MEASHLVLREFIDLFVAPASMERCVYLWEKPKRRSQLLEELLHDARCLRRDRRQGIDSSLSEPEQLLALLRKKGAGQTCFVYGRSDFDEHEVDLRTALAGRLSEVLLYCREARVAFVEEHDGKRFIFSAG